MALSLGQITIMTMKLEKPSESERPDYLNIDGALKNQKVYTIIYKLKVKIDLEGTYSVKTNDSNLFFEWDLSHSKEIKAIQRKTKEQIFGSIFK